MAFKLTDMPFSYKNYPMTLSFYDKPITLSKRLNRFLGQYIDKSEDEEAIKRYFDLIIANGGFFHINSFNFAYVYKDVVEGNITLEFAAGVFALIGKDDFLDILEYFGINDTNYHLFMYEYILSSGIVNKIIDNSIIKKLNKKGDISDEEMQRIYNSMVDSILPIAKDIKILDSETLKDIIESATLQSRNDYS